MDQDRGLWSVRKRSGVSKVRSRLWSPILVSGGVVMMIGYNVPAAEEPVVRSPIRLTYTVTEDGSTYAFWGPEVTDVPKEVTEIQMFVPTDLADAIADAVQNPDGRLEYIIVLRGNSVRASTLCHTHTNGTRECHP